MRRLRVLIAYEAMYNAYAGALECAIRALRPGAEVRVASLRNLWAEASSFAPHLVVSSQTTDAVLGDGAAWFMLSPDPAEPSEFRVGEQRWTYANPDLGVLRRIVASVEGPVQPPR